MLDCVAPFQTIVRCVGPPGSRPAASHIRCRMGRRSPPLAIRVAGTFACLIGGATARPATAQQPGYTYPLTAAQANSAGFPQTAPQQYGYPPTAAPVAPGGLPQTAWPPTDPGTCSPCPDCVTG